MNKLGYWYQFNPFPRQLGNLPPEYLEGNFMGMGYANGSSSETCQLSKSVQLSPDGSGILNVVQENIPLSGGDMKFLRHCICFGLTGGSAVQEKETASIEFQHNRSQLTFIFAKL